MKVLSSSVPHAMMSLVFSRPKAWACSMVNGLPSFWNKNFSSSVQRGSAGVSRLRERGRPTGELDDEGDLEDALQPAARRWVESELRVTGLGRPKAYTVNLKGTMCPRCMLPLLGPRPV